MTCICGASRGLASGHDYDCLAQGGDNSMNTTYEEAKAIGTDELDKFAAQWKTKTKTELHRLGFSCNQTVRIHRAANAYEVQAILQEPKERPVRLR